MHSKRPRYPNWMTAMSNHLDIDLYGQPVKIVDEYINEYVYRVRTWRTVDRNRCHDVSKSQER